MANPPSTPRRRPTQVRSLLTVEAILDASAQLFSEKRFEDVTTNAIATRAGVSIGSLYQYFPNKHILLQALRERHFRRLWRAIGEECGKVVAKPLADALRYVIAAAARLNKENAALVRLFAKELPAYDAGMERLIVARSAFYQQLREFFLAHKSEIRPEVEEAVLVVPTLARGIGTALAIERSTTAGDTASQDQIVNAILRYLT
jgi:AcrR family transcriptional regulator